MEPSVFTKIINGEIPCHKVYEDDQTFAIMDIHPIQSGMIVVISKVQVENAEDLSQESYLSLMKSVHKISKALRRLYSDKFKIAVQIEGLQVQHAHAVLFPINNHSDFTADQPTDEPNHEELEEIAIRIRKEIENVE